MIAWPTAGAERRIVNGHPLKTPDRSTPDGRRADAPAASDTGARFRNRQVVDAGNAHPHQAVLVELPVFVAVAAKPLAAIIVPLVGKAHCDAIFAEGPDFLDEPVIEFADPFAPRNASMASRPCRNSARLRQRLSVVYASATRAGSRVFQRVLRHAHLLGGGFQCKRR